MDSLRELTSLHKALADETRLQMLALLFEFPELCVCHFEMVLGITQSKASRHLRYLLHAGLLADRREGVWMYYRLAENMSTARRLALDVLRQSLPPGLIESLRQRMAAERCLVCEPNRGCEPKQEAS